MPKKKKRNFVIPWWKRRAYKGTDKRAYFLALCDYLENGEVDKTRTLKVRRMRIYL